MNNLGELHPLLIPGVVHQVLEYLPDKDLKISALVSKQWNHEAKKVQHPLLITKVTRNIIQYLEVPDKKTCRQVCKHWKEGVKNYISKDITVVFKNSNDVKKYISDVKLDDCIVVDYQFRASINLGESIVQQFFSEFRSIIEYLDLHRTEWENGVLGKLLFCSLPNLTDLTITFGMLPITEENTLEPVPLLYDLNNTPTLPNLKSLYLNLNIIDEHDGLRPYAKQFILQFVATVPNLQNFKIQCRKYPTKEWIFEFLKLEAKQFPLEILCVCMVL